MHLFILVLIVHVMHALQHQPAVVNALFYSCSTGQGMAYQVTYPFLSFFFFFVFARPKPSSPFSVRFEAASSVVATRLGPPCSEILGRFGHNINTQTVIIFWSRAGLIVNRQGINYY